MVKLSIKAPHDFKSITVGSRVTILNQLQLGLVLQRFVLR